jgi:lysophospholipase L1-like esterase
MSVRNLATRVAAGASLVLLPLLAYQAVRVRIKTPRVPGAQGPDGGRVAGEGEPLRLLLLGESPVDGVGVDLHENGLASHMAQAIAARTGRAVVWRAVGKNGVTARAARRRLIPRLVGSQADLLVVVMGVNDTFYQTSPRRFRGHMGRLLAEARAQVGEVPVLVSAIPPVGSFSTLPQPLRTVLTLRAATLDTVLRGLVARTSQAYYAPLPERAGPQHFCYDQFHPSAVGYAEWGALLASKALECLPSLAATLPHRPA